MSRNTSTGNIFEFGELGFEVLGGTTSSTRIVPPETPLSRAFTGIGSRLSTMEVVSRNWLTSLELEAKTGDFD